MPCSMGGTCGSVAYGYMGYGGPIPPTAARKRLYEAESEGYLFHHIYS